MKEILFGLFILTGIVYETTYGVNYFLQYPNLRSIVSGLLFILAMYLAYHFIIFKKHRDTYIIKGSPFDFVVKNRLLKILLFVFLITSAIFSFIAVNEGRLFAGSSQRGAYLVSGLLTLLSYTILVAKVKK